jgi:kynurenine formamidase
MERVRRIAEKISNWGRWGADDERGTLNLITPDVVKRATACVRRGDIFSLGLSLGGEGPQTGSVIGRFNPQHYMTAIGSLIGDDPRGFCYSDDVLSLPLQSVTQWDSLAHVHYDGKLYNGYVASEVLGPSGATKNGIDKLAVNGIVSRGVLVDVARHRGIDRVAPGTAIRTGEIDDILAAQGSKLLPGDILVIRTGHLSVFKNDGDRETYLWQGPGLGLDAAEWIRARDLAAVCSDTTAVEVMPCEDPSLLYPLHLLCLRDMGMTFGEMFDLDELAADCAADGCWEFLLTAPPLKVTGGIGSPINPLAIK